AGSGHFYLNWTLIFQDGKCGKLFLHSAVFSPLRLYSAYAKRVQNLPCPSLLYLHYTRLLLQNPSSRKKGCNPSVFLKNEVVLYTYPLKTEFADFGFCSSRFLKILKIGRSYWLKQLQQIPV